MRDYYAHPVAVLLDRGVPECLIRVSDPPPPFYEIPIQQRWSLDQEREPPRYEPIPRLTFKLSRWRTRDYQWMRVYDGGRSQTLEDAYVYFRVGQPTAGIDPHD